MRIKKGHGAILDIYTRLEAEWDTQGGQGGYSTKALGWRTSDTHEEGGKLLDQDTRPEAE